MDTDSRPYQCRSDIDRLAREAGAIAWGIAEASPLPEEEARRLDAWIEAGFNASMDYLARHAPLKRMLDNVLPGCRSVVSLAFPYFSGQNDAASDVVFARYARGDDYHEVLRKRLIPLARYITENYGAKTRICVDSAPVAEAFWAKKSGVGVKCRNGLVAVPGYGTWVFLAEILTTAVFDKELYTEPRYSAFELCGECEACIKACPAKAIMPGAQIDCRRCRSYLTIEYRGESLPEDVKLGKRVYGCDICQEVCPLNRDVPDEISSVVPPREEISRLTREQLMGLDEESFRKLFSHSAVRRVNSNQLRRNCKS